MDKIDIIENSDLNIKIKEQKKKKKWQQFKENFELLLLALPGILLFFVFNYLPMGGIIIAFKDFRYDLGILGSKWVGLKNFEFFFTSQDAFRITRNTVGYGLSFLVVGTIAAVIVALLLFELKNKIALKVYQTTMILPTFLSWVIVGFITHILLDPVMGGLNQFLGLFGAHPVNWYNEVALWPFILVIVMLWKTIGMSSIVYYAALMGVDSQIYEAAIIDGASKWKQTIHISIPSLIPVITILSILGVGGLFRGDFGLNYQITKDLGSLYPVTDIIETYLFRGLRAGEFGIATAVGLFQSVVGLILVVSTNLIVKRIDPERSLF
jgi:putative aldouronate transport system permease protein